MNDDLQVAVINFKKALSSLEQGIKEAKGELEKDGVIQRFEFTFELMWKTLKIFLYNEGIECKSPRDCLSRHLNTVLFKMSKLFWICLMIEITQPTFTVKKNRKKSLEE